VVTCGEKRNVFGFNVDTKKSVVMAPQHCMVGCDNCASNCLWDAITFPHNDAYVKNFSRKISKEQIAKELENKLKDNPQLLID
jgi:ferredoxin